MSVDGVNLQASLAGGAAFRGGGSWVIEVLINEERHGSPIECRLCFLCNVDTSRIWSHISHQWRINGQLKGLINLIGTFVCMIKKTGSQIVRCAICDCWRRKWIYKQLVCILVTVLVDSEPILGTPSTRWKCNPWIICLSITHSFIFRGMFLRSRRNSENPKEVCTDTGGTMWNSSQTVTWGQDWAVRQQCTTRMHPECIHHNKNIQLSPEIGHLLSRLNRDWYEVAKYKTHHSRIANKYNTDFKIRIV